jgi:hypothetical protein
MTSVMKKKMLECFSFVALSLTFFIVGCGTTNQQKGESANLVVTGTGKTVDEALSKALNDAVRKSSNTLQITERAVKNEELQTKQLNYSRGIVKNFTILKQEINPQTGEYKLEVRVTVDADGKKNPFTDNGTQGVEVNQENLYKLLREENSKDQIAATKEKNIFEILQYHLKNFINSFYIVTFKEIVTSLNDGEVKLKVRLKLETNVQSYKNICSSIEEITKNRGENRFNQQLQAGDKIQCRDELWKLEDFQIYTPLDTVYFEILTKEIMGSGICLKFPGSETVFMEGKSILYSINDYETAVQIFLNNPLDNKIVLYGKIPRNIIEPSLVTVDLVVPEPLASNVFKKNSRFTELEVKISKLDECK